MSRGKSISNDFQEVVLSEFHNSKFYRENFSLQKESIEKAGLCLREVISEMENPFKINLPVLFAHSAIVLSPDEIERFKNLLLKLVTMDERKYLHKAFNFHFWHMLLTIIGRLKKDFDYMLIIDGYEGTGKSRFALSLAYFYKHIVFGEKFVDANLALSPLDVANSFLEFAGNDEKLQPIIFDEGGTVMFSRDAMSKFGKRIIKVLKVARMMNWLLIVVAQNISWVDPYIRFHRVTGWVHIKSRGYATYVPGKVLKEREEFLARHFNPDKLANKLPHYDFGFSDFDFDEEILQWYMERKKNYVSLMINEMRDNITELQKVYQPNEITSLMNNYYIRYAIPFITDWSSIMPNIDETGFVIRDSFPEWQMSSLNTTVFNAESDPIGRYFFGGEDLLTSISLEMLKEDYNISEVTVKTTRHFFKKRKISAKYWVYGFDIWRYVVSGMAMSLAINYVQKKGYAPYSILYFYFDALTSLFGCENFFEAMMLATYPFKPSLRLKFTTLFLEASQNRGKVPTKQIMEYVYAQVPIEEQIAYLRQIYEILEMVLIGAITKELEEKNLDEQTTRMVLKFLLLPVANRRIRNNFKEEFFRNYFNKEYKKSSSILEKSIKVLLSPETNKKIKPLKELEFHPRKIYENVSVILRQVRYIQILSEVLDKVLRSEEVSTANLSLSELEKQHLEIYLNALKKLLEEKAKATLKLYEEAIKQHEELKKKIPKEEAQIQKLREEKEIVSEVVELFMQLDKAVDQYVGEKEGVS